MPLSKESHMHMAIAAWKEKKPRLILEAARVFQVPESTLRTQLAGIKPQLEIHTNGHKLTEIKEKSLIEQILDADK